MKHIRTAPKGTAPLGDARRWVWTEQAACAGEDLALFYGRPKESTKAREAREERAKDLCFSCIARKACLEEALSRKPYDQHGVQGGMTRDERRDEYRRRVRRARNLGEAA
jgi:WhiB family redox-sensing transcriptional regulator